MNPQVRDDARRSLAILQQYNASSPRLKTEGELYEEGGSYYGGPGLIFGGGTGGGSNSWSNVSEASWAQTTAGSWGNTQT